MERSIRLKVLELINELKSFDGRATQWRYESFSASQLILQTVMGSTQYIANQSARAAQESGLALEAHIADIRTALRLLEEFLDENLQAQGH